MTKKRAPGGGRKPLAPTEPTVKVAITLLASQVEAMNQLGNGNLSAGIRKAIENMTTVTIEQKMSGTGTIHDLASQHFDRHIEFGDDDKYAIVLAAYYGNGDNYYLAKSKEEAIALHERHAEFSHAIIDRDGDPVSVDWLYYS